MAIVRERAGLIGDMTLLNMAKAFGVAKPITTPYRRNVIKRSSPRRRKVGLVGSRKNVEDRDEKMGG